MSKTKLMSCTGITLLRNNCSNQDALCKSIPVKMGYLKKEDFFFHSC